MNGHPLFKVNALMQSIHENSRQAMLVIVKGSFGKLKMLLNHQ